MIELENVSFSYKKNTNILEDINLKINEGELVILLGQNGNGKTTLLKCINKLLKVNNGDILINNKNISSYRANELAKEISYVPQILDFGNMTVFDTILTGRIPYIKWDISYDDLKIVNDLIDKFKLDKYALTNVCELSGGERQKVAIARALAQEPKILLFDEPTANLDIKNQMEVMNLIADICREKNITVLITMHDINLSLRYGNRFVLLKKGKIIFDAKAENLSKEAIDNCFNVDSKIVDIDGISTVIIKEEK